MEHQYAIIYHNISKYATVYGICDSSWEASAVILSLSAFCLLVWSRLQGICGTVRVLGFRV